MNERTDTILVMVTICFIVLAVVSIWMVGGLDRDDDDSDRYALRIVLRNDVMPEVNFTLLVNGQVMAQDSITQDANYTYWWMLCEDASWFNSPKTLVVEVLTEHGYRCSEMVLDELPDGAEASDVPTLYVEIGFTEGVA